MEEDLNKRLNSEAEFQNKRSKNRSQGKKEFRASFYFLAFRAWDKYRELTLDNCKGKTVLVAGCSEGGVTPLAKAGAKKVYGIDIADEPITVLTESIKNEGLSDIAFASVGNAESIDFPSQSLDLICCSGVLHHLDIKKAIQSWKSALTSDGKIVMLEPMAMNPIIFLFRLLTPSMRTPDEHPLVPRDFRYFEENFSSVVVKGYVLTSMASLILFFAPNLMQRVCKTLEKVDDYLIEKLPILVHFTWTATIVLSRPIRD